MNIFRTLGSFLGVSEKKVGDTFDGGWLPLGGGSDGVNTRNLLDANKEWVYVAVDRNAKSVAGVRFKVMRYRKNGDDQEVFDGPLVDFLEQPGAGLTGKDFIYLNTAYKELTGNAFWERLKARKVAPLIPTNVAPVISGGALTAYKYTEGPKTREIQLKDMLHDRYMDLSRPYWGAGKLQKIARWVDTSSYVTEFLSRFFVNGATFGGFIETDEETETRIKLIKIGLQNDHVGVRNAHKLGILPKGSKYAKAQANMAEMEMGETDDRYRDKILATFGVPKSMLGLTTDVNRANAEAMEYMYSKYTVKPIVDDLIEFLNVNVAPMLEGSGEYYYAYDDFVPANQELQIKEREIALNKQPYKTVNEVRAEAGLPPVKGGDVVYGAAGTVPLGEPQPAAVAPATDPNADQPKKAIPSRVRRFESRERALDSIVEKLAEVAVTHIDQDAVSHKAFVGRVGDHEKLVADKVRDFNNRQEREVSQNLKQITKAVQKGDLFDMEREVSVLVDFVTPMLKGLMVEQAIQEYLDQAFPGDFDQTMPRVANVVAAAAARLAKSYNRTTAKLLANTLNEGIGQGEDLTQLAERVRSVYQFSNTTRADAVARTEAFYIANEGSREAYRQSGVVKSMRWYTAEDERVCPWCGPQHGRVVGVNEVFFRKGETLTAEGGKKLVLDYRAIDVPPLHTSCRCFIRPETIEV